MQQGTTALLWGLPGTTKTTHAVDWWGRLSLGLDWCDAQVAKGISFYLPLEDRAGFRARVDAWEEHNATRLPPWALWWDGDFDFSNECATAVRQAMEAKQSEHGLPVVFACLDPIMKTFGEGTALDEQDFRKRLAMIECIMAPFADATALVVQHAGWDGKHELGSVIQRALTATSIKAAITGDVATLTIVRQKNDEEGRVLTFRKQPLGDKGRIVMVPAAASVTKSHRLTGVYKLAYDALVKAIDDANQAGQTLPKVSEGLSERVSVDLWISEFTRFRSDGSDIRPDSIRHSLDRAKRRLQALKIIGVYDNLAWIDWRASDKSDKGSDK